MSAAREHVLNALEVYITVHTEGEDLTPADIDLDLAEIDEAVDVMREAERVQAAMAQIVKACRQRVGEVLGEGGATRRGDTIYRYNRKNEEHVIDADAASAYFTERVRQGQLEVGDLVNPQYVKRSWMDDAVRDTFYVRQKAEDPTVIAIPIDRAPKFLQRLEDGQAVHI